MWFLYGIISTIVFNSVCTFRIFPSIFIMGLLQVKLGAGLLVCYPDVIEMLFFSLAAFLLICFTRVNNYSFCKTGIAHSSKVICHFEFGCCLLFKKKWIHKLEWVAVLKWSSAHALGGVSGVASFISTDEQLQYNRSCCFLVQAMLPEGFPFHKFKRKVYY